MRLHPLYSEDVVRRKVGETRFFVQPIAIGPPWITVTRYTATYALPLMVLYFQNCFRHCVKVDDTEHDRDGAVVVAPGLNSI